MNAVARIFLALWCVGVLAGKPCSCAAGERVITVGVYQNYPKVFTAKDGSPSGFFVELLEEIAKAESWRIEYRFGTWAEGLEGLSAGRIDLMPDVAVSKAREESYDFNALPVLSEWQQVYARKGAVFGELKDLAGKTVALLEDSRANSTFPELVERLGVEVRIETRRSYQELIESVESGRADAMVVSRFFAFFGYGAGPLRPTPLVFHPSKAAYAAKKGKNADILAGIDAHLAEMINDPDSSYYLLLKKWLREEPETKIPGSLLWALFGVGVAAVFGMLVAGILRWQVNLKTRQLAEKNKDLERALDDLRVAREDALKRERLYAFGQLASGLAHDFNNILSPIGSCVELLRLSPSKEKMDNYIAIIGNAARSGTAMVERMTHFCKTRELDASKEPVDLSEVARDVVELMEPQVRRLSVLGGREILVTQELSASATVMGNRSDVHEMLLNLMLNALDAMPEGGEIVIRTARDDERVALSVSDSGVGMSEEVRANCLSPFFSTKGARGTGMGLAMVASLASRNHGRVEIESKDGEGSTFTVVFAALCENID